MILTAGSFCSGALGLEHGMSSVLDLDLAWVADLEPGPSALLAHHHPDVPNLGDLTALDWSQVPAVDLMCGGYPCTPFSQAGRRKGTADPRHIWPHVAAGIAVLRPRLVFLENVRGHLTLGFDVVLAGLAAMGYDAAWTVVAASDSGAPHGRKRLFVLAVREGLACPPGLPVAVLEHGAWVTPGEGLFGPVPFAGRIPEDGVMCGGRMLARGSAASRGLLPTPDATHGRKTTRTGPLLPGVAESLLPTPRVSGGSDITEPAPSSLGGRHGTDLGPALVQATALLRTPTAQLAVNGGSQHPDKRKAGGHGPTLADEVEHLLPTPNATDGQGGPRAVPEFRTSGGKDHGPRLWDVAPDLLPTPRSADGMTEDMAVTRERLARGVRPRSTLEEAAALLPTPGASDWKGSGATQGRERDGRPRPPGDADLPEVVAMLPTPSVADVTGGHRYRSGARRGELLLPGVAEDLAANHAVAALLPTPKAPPRDIREAAEVKLGTDYDGDLEAVIIDLTSRKRRKDRATHGQLIIPGTTITPPPPVWDLSDTAEAWGKYAPAIARWETILGRLAPAPTMPGRDGKPRLSPLAVEFMMACPEGWVTGVPGLSRNQMLRILGNGCVAPQAAIAAARLFAAVAALSPAALAERSAS